MIRRRQVSGLVALLLCCASLLLLLSSSSPCASTSASSLKDFEPRTFDRILQVWLENTGMNETIQEPFFRNLVRQHGQLLTRSYGVTHPSQPNYLAGTAGDFFNKNTNEDLNLDVTSIVDLLEKGGISWKTYQENYPKYTGQGEKEGWVNGCYVKSISDDKLYYRKHNPFMSYNNVRASRSRCARIVPAEQLAVDIANNDIPQYMFYTPNIDNDGHDTGIEFAARWLEKFITPLLNNRRFMEGTLVVVTFDEDDYHGDNRIYTALFGPMVEPGTVDMNYYTHYSILRTVEDNWQLGTLGRNDAKATPLQKLTKRK